VALVAVQGWQVFARYVLNDSPGLDRTGGPVAADRRNDRAAPRCGVHHWTRHFAFTLLAMTLRPAGACAARSFLIVTKLVIVR
jgi:hypothetical protein